MTEQQQQAVIEYLNIVREVELSATDKEQAYIMFVEQGAISNTLAIIGYTPLWNEEKQTHELEAITPNASESTLRVYRLMSVQASMRSVRDGEYRRAPAIPLYFRSHKTAISAAKELLAVGEGHGLTYEDITPAKSQQGVVYKKAAYTRGPERFNPLIQHGDTISLWITEIEVIG